MAAGEKRGREKVRSEKSFGYFKETLLKTKIRASCRPVSI